ncbi:helix-turn-helix domain-containing protein [Chryseobacterium sp. VAUSW3]|uniref:helix-turn-helix domain-containing protein n=1 Tax=Chryseobacterium sp. VAUSW3 TaxID=2010998 RepID=UPI001E5532F1|nr:helix-turn-helix domain-containing protein [Chryseobacterium sp. VAUSW3]
MEQQKFIRCQKYTYQKLPFQIKLQIVQKVTNGQISINHAAKTYGISRSTIDYWVKKLATFNQKSIGMSQDQEIKKLKEKSRNWSF